MLFPAFFRRKFSVNKMKENTIFRCLFYISSVFGKIQYGKRHHFYAKDLLSIPSQDKNAFRK